MATNNVWVETVNLFFEEWESVIVIKISGFIEWVKVRAHRHWCEDVIGEKCECDIVGATFVGAKRDWRGTRAGSYDVSEEVDERAMALFHEGNVGLDHGTWVSFNFEFAKAFEMSKFNGNCGERIP